MIWLYTFIWIYNELKLSCVVDHWLEGQVHLICYNLFRTQTGPYLKLLATSYSLQKGNDRMANLFLFICIRVHMSLYMVFNIKG